MNTPGGATTLLVGSSPEAWRRRRCWEALSGVEVRHLAWPPGSCPPPPDSPLATSLEELRASAEGFPLRLHDLAVPVGGLLQPFGALLQKRGLYILSGNLMEGLEEQGRWLETLVRNNRLQATLGNTWRYRPSFARLKELLLTGRLAAPRRITVRCGGPLPALWPWLDAALWFLADPSAAWDPAAPRRLAGTQGEILFDETPATEPRLFLESAAGTATLSATGLEVEWPREGIPVRRSFSFPDYHLQAELGCQLQEAASGAWQVCPTADAMATLRLLRMLLHREKP